MKMTIARIRTALSGLRFRRDESGSMAIETALIIPMLCWAYLATWVYFDAFRIQTTTMKAAETIADQLGRETGYVTPTYLTSLYKMHEFLTQSNYPSKLRISVVQYQTTGDKFIVRWSQTKGGAPVLTNTTVTNMRSQLPIVPNNEIVIVVENWLTYEPQFTVGLSAFPFYNLIVTRPRFAAQLCYNSSDTGSTTTATC